MRRGKSRELVTYTRGYIDRLKESVSMADDSARYWRNQANARREERDNALADLDAARVEVSRLEQTARSATYQRDEAEQASVRLARSLGAVVFLVGESIGLEVKERR